MNILRFRMILSFSKGVPAGLKARPRKAQGDGVPAGLKARPHKAQGFSPMWLPPRLRPERPPANSLPRKNAAISPLQIRTHRLFPSSMTNGMSGIEDSETARIAGDLSGRGSFPCHTWLKPAEALCSARAAFQAEGSLLRNDPQVPETPPQFLASLLITPSDERRGR